MQLLRPVSYGASKRQLLRQLASKGIRADGTSLEHGVDSLWSIKGHVWWWHMHGTSLALLWHFHAWTFAFLASNVFT